MNAVAFDDNKIVELSSVLPPAHEAQFVISRCIATVKFNEKLDRTIFKSKNYAVLSAIGPISIEGYLLIVTKEHKYCFANSTIDQIDELKDVIQGCRALLSKIYNKKSIVFEHGSVSELDNKKAGTSTSHAHIHVVPVEISLLQEIRKKYTVIKLQEMYDIVEFHRKIQPYLFFEDNEENRHICNADEVERQYLR